MQNVKLLDQEHDDFRADFLDWLLPEKPTRLLRKPFHLLKNGDYLVMSSLNKRWKILEWEGPEEKSDRTYYRVLTESGQILWIYSTLEDEGFFLQGYYD